MKDDDQAKVEFGLYSQGKPRFECLLELGSGIEFICEDEYDEV